MTPSRSAHGHTETSSRPSTSSAACATTAPASSCPARLGRDARQRRPLRGGHGLQPVDRLRQAAAPQPARDPRALGVRRRAVEPGERAEGLARHDARGRGGPPVEQPVAHLAHLLAGAARAPPRRPSCAAGRRRSRSRVSRPAPSGSDSATSGSSSRPAASSSEPPPMSRHSRRPGAPAEPPAHREEGQPGLVLAGQHAQVDAGVLAHRAQDVGRVGGVADRRGREGDEVVDALVLGGGAGLGGRPDEHGCAVRPERAVGLQELGEAQLLLVRADRVGVGALVGVDDEQVHRVGPDVQDPEPHAAQATDQGPRRAAGAAAPVGFCGVSVTRTPAAATRRTGPRRDAARCSRPSTTRPPERPCAAAPAARAARQPGLRPAARPRRRRRRAGQPGRPRAGPRPRAARARGRLGRAPPASAAGRRQRSTPPATTRVAASPRGQAGARRARARRAGARRCCG